MMDTDFEILNKHFRYCMTLEFRLLDNQNHQCVDILNSLLNYEWINKTIIVTKVDLNKNTVVKNHSCFYKQKNGFDRKEQVRFNYENKKGIVLIGDHLSLFEEYFGTPMNSMEENRSLYVLVLPPSSEPLSPDIFLRRLWTLIRLLNVLIYIPNIGGFVYVYRPFDWHNGDYGRVEMLRKSEIQIHPYLMVNNAKDLKGWPMKVSIFPRKTSALTSLPRLLTDYQIYGKIAETTQLYGVDGVLTSEISLALNFNVSKVDYGLGFGVAFMNMTGTGSTGLILRKEADLQGNPRFLSWSPALTRLEYTSYFSQDELCVIVSKSSLMPKWLKPFLDIQMLVWIMILTYIVISVYINNLLHIPENRCLINSWLEIFGMTISQYSSRLNYRGRWMRRIFLSCILFCSINLTSMFSATMYEAFTTKTYYNQIRTLEELDSNNMIIKSSIRAFKGSPRELYQNLDKKTSTNYRGLGLDLVAYSGKNYAALERYYDAKILLQTKYIKDDGVSLLHMLPDCL
ncbi:hypothetical protein GWI33_014456, partial [Rhynchophorus ferrugineus]